MNIEKTDEIGLRRKLFRLFDKGKSIPQILKLVPRSRSWIYKWQKRFELFGRAAAMGAKKTPRHSPHAYPPAVVHTILTLRKRLQKETVGLVGAKAIRRELKRRRLVTPLPSLSTINRLLKAHGLIATRTSDTEEKFYPWVRTDGKLVFHSLDWMLRYITGGEKVFIFHTLDMTTHALAQTLSGEKSTAAVINHALGVWQQMGVPDFLHIDNDAAFTGLGKSPRVFGRFVRLALFFGIELIFIPPAEARRNHLIEGVNHLFAQSFWEKNEFSSMSDVERKRGRFLAWYASYEPPALGGASVAEANRNVCRRRLTQKERAGVPAVLPLTKGRIHFVRKVDHKGEIEILKERWKVSRRLVNCYVWATLLTAPRRLRIYHRRSARATVKLIKEYEYEVGERVVPLPDYYRHRRSAIKVPNLF